MIFSESYVYDACFRFFPFKEEKAEAAARAPLTAFAGQGSVDEQQV